MKKTFEDDRERSGWWRTVTPHYQYLPGLGLRAYESLRARQFLHSLNPKR
jgi:hypothetical protein